MIALQIRPIFTLLAVLTGDWVIRAVVDCGDAVPAAPAWSRLAVAPLLLVGGALVLGARRASVHSR